MVISVPAGIGCRAVKMMRCWLKLCIALGVQEWLTRAPVGNKPTPAHRRGRRSYAHTLTADIGRGFVGSCLEAGRAGDTTDYGAPLPTCDDNYAVEQSEREPPKAAGVSRYLSSPIGRSSSSQMVWLLQAQRASISASDFWSGKSVSSDWLPCM